MRWTGPIALSVCLAASAFAQAPASPAHAPHLPRGLVGLAAIPLAELLRRLGLRLRAGRQGR